MLHYAIYGLGSVASSIRHTSEEARRDPTQFIRQRRGPDCGYVGDEIDLSICLQAVKGKWRHVELRVPFTKLSGTPFPWSEVPERPAVPGCVTLKTACETILKWLRACRTSHGCVGGTEHTSLPKRVVEILTHDNFRIRPPTHRQQGPYLCLSLCWGSEVPYD
jgi:hypothetical protein